MLKREITYLDLDDNPITETFWFNLNQAEMAKMALSKEGKDGGFDFWVRKLIASKNGAQIVEAFEQILLMTIGQRSDDNKSFIKSDEIRENFKNSDAYSELFMDLITDMDKVSAFVNGVMPAKMREKAEQDAKKIANDPASVSESGPPALPDLSTPATPPVPVSEQPRTITATPEPKDDRPEWLKNGSIPTTEQLRGATPEQLQEAFRRRAEGAGPVKQEEITGS